MRAICKSRQNIPAQKLKPGFSTYYDLGVKASKHMKPVATLDEVGAAFGLTRQNAYTETVVALGKLVFRLKEQVQEPTNF